MATLKDYFELNNKTLSFLKTSNFEVRSIGNIKHGNFTILYRLHFDFESNAFYISIYIEKTNLFKCPVIVALSRIKEILAFKEDFLIELKSPGEILIKTSDMIFTRRIIIYDENTNSEIYDNNVLKQAFENNHFVQIRRIQYAMNRSNIEKPFAFVSHDSRDKELIAKPIVHELMKLACPVWFDEYSFNIGDSLRESIEKGIKDAKKCILIITPNFLNNSGWTKAEFNSVITKDILKKNRSILPIWCGVTQEEVYEYSPMLLDTVALIWPLSDDKKAEENKKLIINKLRNSITK